MKRCAVLCGPVSGSRCYHARPMKTPRSSRSRYATRRRVGTSARCGRRTTASLQPRAASSISSQRRAPRCCAVVEGRTCQASRSGHICHISRRVGGCTVCPPLSDNLTSGKRPSHCRSEPDTTSALRGGDQSGGCDDSSSPVIAACFEMYIATVASARQRGVGRSTKVVHVPRI
jgi:hypothetical protein